MGSGQFFERVGKQRRRHSVVRQERRPIVIRLLFKILGILRLHHRRGRRGQKAADVADIQGPERADGGAPQQQLQAMASMRMSEFVGEYRQCPPVVADGRDQIIENDDPAIRQREGVCTELG